MASAGRLDSGLAEFLGRVQRGEIHDGGADSLADAANAGWAQARVGVPDPGRRPPHDKGAGEHGSDPWWTRGEDLLVAGFLGDAANVADARGWTHAAELLHHYLGNSGADYSVDPDQMARDTDFFGTTVDHRIGRHLGALAADAARNGSYGQPVQFDTGWDSFGFASDTEPDWFYAMGEFRYSVTGVATVHPPADPGGQPTVEVDYRVHVDDRYNWDNGKKAAIGDLTVNDEQLGALHRAGVAQEFNVSGSTETKHYAGPIPAGPSEVPDLPAAPDSRDGTRSDPERYY